MTDKSLGVSKKLVETLKGGELTQEVLGPCLSAFRSLVESSPSPELLRSLALSITYVLHKPSPSATLKKKKSLRFIGSSTRPGSSKSDSEKYVANVSLGIQMLRLYADILCNPHDSTPLKKFAKAVTNKVRQCSLPSSWLVSNNSSGSSISRAKMTPKLCPLQSKF